MLHVIYNLILLFGLWTLASAVEEKNFLNLIVGLFALATGFGLLMDDRESARKFGTDGESFRMDGAFYMLFACLWAGRTAFYHLPFTFNVVLRFTSFGVVGLALIVLAPGPLTNQIMFTKRGAAAKGSHAVNLPEYVARLGLFAACLGIAAVGTVLLVKDERLRLACFLTTMIVGLVGTKVLPLKALKWVLSSVSLKKLKSDD